MTKLLIVGVALAVVLLLIFGSLKSWRQKISTPSAQPVQPAPASLTLGPGNYDFSLEHGGLTRTYKVYAPQSYNKNNPTPVILALHGGGGTSANMESMTLLDNTSDKDGFLVVYPQGTGKTLAGHIFGTWNAGRCCHPAIDTNVDDVGFISALIDKLKTDFNVDAKRVFATGHSNGSYMSWRLACELGNKIAAVAPASGPGVFDNCAPQKPVPAIYFHGTADPCEPYNGGTAGHCTNDFYKKWLGLNIPAYSWQVDSVSDYINKWKVFNGIADSPPQVTYEKGQATCNTFGLNTKGEIELCVINGMGHTWPGGTYGDVCKGGYSTRECIAFRETLGALNNDISANDQMWAFFQRHPMQ